MYRDRRPELMEDPALAAGEHSAALRSLNRANRWFGVDRGLWRAIGGPAAAESASVMELGVGGGSFLEYAPPSGNGRPRPMRIGVDISPRALEISRRLAVADFHRVAADARRLPMADHSVDFVTCSLLLHHFDAEGVVRILREAARVARRGVAIGDLERSRLALAATWLTARVISRSRVFHVDAPLSVRAAYRPDELSELAAQAGLRGARVHRAFPFRMILVWRKGGAT